MGFYTAKANLFCNEQLFEMVLNHFNPKTREGRQTLLSVLMVETNWFDRAAHVLWREATSKALSYLLPRYTPRQVLEPRRWADALSPEDYARLKVYAPHIANLVHDDKIHNAQDALMFEAFILGSSFPIGKDDEKPIFTRLTHLEWKRTELSTHHDETNPLRNCVRPGERFLEFVGRISTGRLRTLLLDVPVLVEPCVDGWVQFFQGLRDLKCLTFPLPLTACTMAVLNGLSKLKCLERLSTITSRCQTDDFGNFGFTPEFQEGAFPRLKGLHLACYPRDVSQLLGARYAPKELVELTILLPFTRDLHNATSRDINSLFRSIASHCKRLKKLSCYYDRHDGRFPSVRRHDIIHAESFRPLYALRNMISFRFACTLEVRFAQEDIEALASSWPSLKHLQLESEELFSVITDKTLNLDALLPLARHCPNLEDLKISLSCQNGPLLKNADHPLPTFQKLKALHLFPGFTSLPAPQDLVLTLFRMYPSPGRWTFTYPWDHSGYSAYYKSLDRIRQIELVLLRERIQRGWKTATCVVDALSRYQRDLHRIPEEKQGIRMRAQKTRDEAPIGPCRVWSFGETFTNALGFFFGRA
ncbi:unnamed protein product [Somion occarium]|uniref:F-box domain-containing protein n=1 Tax=Somion occarium TaxID=3059160 RepID=A0ABP1D8V2_9APHY